MNAEFQWWLLILGIVIGGALVYLVLADMRADDGEPEWPGDWVAGGPPDDRRDDVPVPWPTGADEGATSASPATEPSPAVDGGPTGVDPPDA